MIIRNLDLRFLARYRFVADEYSDTGLGPICRNLIKILSFAGSAAKHCGTVQREDLVSGRYVIPDHEHVITLTPDWPPGFTASERVVLFVHFDDNVWGKMANLCKIIDNFLLPSLDGFSMEGWKRLITLSGTRVERKRSAQKRFLGDSFRIRRLGRAGWKKLVPVISRNPSHQEKKYRYGLSYGVDFSQYDASIKKRARAIARHFADEESKACYLGILFEDPQTTWRRYYADILGNNQYGDCVSLDKHSVIINCGVENGAEIPQFLSYGPRKMICVDPSDTDILSPYTKRWVDHCRDTVEFEHAALCGSGGAARVECRISVEEGKYVTRLCDAISLPDIIKKYSLDTVSLIKTDIEGYERYIIDDLAEITRKFRPQLALSIYHTDADGKLDLLEMPEKVFAACEGYRFHVRHYSYQLFETILYAIPT